MKGPPYRDGLDRAARVACESRFAAIAASLVGRSEASARSSVALTFARRGRNQFRSLPAAERTRCLLIAAAAALGGHVALSILLPASASPTLILTVLALLGVGLAAAVSAQRGAGEKEVLQPDRIARRPD